MNNREKEIKNALDKDVYHQIEDLKALQDETLSSTAKLADILDGYMARVSDTSFETVEDSFEIIDSENVEVEVDDEDLLMQYNEKLHQSDLNTLADLMGELENKDYSELTNSETKSFTVDELLNESKDTNDFKNDINQEYKDTGATTLDLGEVSQSMKTPDPLITLDDIDLEENRDSAQTLDLSVESDDSDSIQKEAAETNKGKLIDFGLIIVLVILIIFVGYTFLGAQ